MTKKEKKQLDMIELMLSHGISYQKIADKLGVTKLGFFQRYTSLRVKLLRDVFGDWPRARTTTERI